MPPALAAAVAKKKRGSKYEKGLETCSCNARATSDIAHAHVRQLPNVVTKRGCLTSPKLAAYAGVAGLDPG